MGEAIFFLIIAVLCLGGYFLICKGEKKSVNQTVQKESSKISLLSIPDSKIELYGNIGSNHGVITNTNELYLIDNNCSSYDKVNYSDILDIKMDLHVVEKNARRIIAWTSTYDKTSQINRIDLKIITSFKTYTIFYTPGANTPKGLYHGSLGNKIDDTERFKLIIENEINKLKTTN